MPIIKSAKKRVRTSEKATARNNRTRKSIRNSIKALQIAIEKSDKKQIPKHKQIPNSKSQIPNLSKSQI